MRIPSIFWRPIKTAPLEVEMLVCGLCPYEICQATLEDDGECYATCDGGIFTNATHWMPIPEPPVKTTAAED